MPLLNTAKDALLGDVPVKKVYRGATEVWSPPSTGPKVRDFRHGYGTQTRDVPYAFDLAGLTGERYLFHYRNQTIGTMTPVGLTFLAGTAFGGGRMTIWKIDSDTPTLAASGSNAVVNWTAVEVDPSLVYAGAQETYAASNATPEVPASGAGGSAPCLVCYAANNFAPWVQNGDEPVRADSHTEARPATMTAFFNSGPPPDGDRGSTLTRIEGSGTVWFS
jgi:hypothetical protein